MSRPKNLGRRGKAARSGVTAQTRNMGAAAAGRFGRPRRCRRGRRRRRRRSPARGRCRCRPPVSAGPSPRTKRSKIWSRMLGGMPGPSSATSTTASPPWRRRRSSIARAGRSVAGGVVEQVEHHAVQLVGVALDGERRLVLDRQLALAQRRAPPRPPRCRPPRPGRRARAARPGRRRRGRAAAGRRRAGSSAARSAGPSRPSPAPRRRGARAARPAAVRGWRGRWSAACAARARRRRRTRAAFFIAASRSCRAASSERSICSRVRASSPTSSSTLGSGMWRRRVAGVGDLARGRGQRRDRPHRPRRRSPRPRGWRAACRRAMPATMKSQRRSTVESTWATLRPY